MKTIKIPTRLQRAWQRNYGGLSKPVYILFFARTVNRMGDFVKLFLTLYLTQILGMPTETAGMFVMLSAGSSMAGGLLGGSLTDIFGRRRMILGLQLMSTVSVGICGFLEPTIAIAWVLIFAAGAMGAVRPVVNSIVADITAGPLRQRAFSLLYLGTNMGVAIGPIIAGFLFRNYLHWIFWGDALSTLVAFSLVLLWVPETKPSSTDISQSLEGDFHLEQAEGGSMLQALLRRPVLLLFAPLGIISNFIYSQHAFTIPLHLSSLWGERGAELFGTIMSLNAMVVLIATTGVLFIFGRFKPLNNMVYASLFFMIGFGVLFFAESFPLFLVSTVLWTIGEIILVTNLSVFIANHTPITHRGRFNGLLSLIFGLGFTIGPYFSGFAIGSIGVDGMWRITGIVAGVNALLFFLLFRYDQRRSRRIAAAAAATS